MPFINVKVILNVYSDVQERGILERSTDAIVAIEGGRGRLRNGWRCDAEVNLVGSHCSASSHH